MYSLQYANDKRLKHLDSIYLINKILCYWIILQVSRNRTAILDVLLCQCDVYSRPAWRFWVSIWLYVGLSLCSPRIWMSRAVNVEYFIRHCGDCVIGYKLFPFCACTSQLVIHIWYHAYYCNLISILILNFMLQPKLNPRRNGYFQTFIVIL